MNDTFSLREYVSLVEACYKDFRNQDSKSTNFFEDYNELNEVFACHQTNCKPVERKDFYWFAKNLIKELPNTIDISGWLLGVSFEPLPDLDAVLFTNTLSIDLELKDKIDTQNLGDIKKKFNKQSRLFKKINEKIPTLYLVYIAKENKLYCYSHEEKKYKEDYSFKELAESLKNVKPQENNPIKKLSRSEFLISPLDNINEFINNEYFLDSPQEDVKNELFQYGINRHGGIFGVEGAAGTGKSLIAYDLVKTLNTTPILFIYPGDLKEKHKSFNQHFSNLKFCSGKDLTENLLNKYPIIIIDEAQRLYHDDPRNTLGILTNWIKKNYNDHTVIFFFDVYQSLGPKDCGQLLHNLCKTYEKDGKGKLLYLNASIRSNNNIFYFVRNLFDLKKKAPKWITTLDYKQNIEVKYFADSTDSLDWIKLKIQEGYHFLLPTKDRFNNTLIDKYDPLEEYSKNTHHAIGEENNKIITVIDKSVKYTTDGQIEENPIIKSDYFYYIDHELYVNMTRAREKLAIAIIDNFDVYKAIMEVIFEEKGKK